MASEQEQQQLPTLPVPQGADVGEGATVATVGWLVTNHLNLFYMLGSGLVMPPEGFGHKHYEDTLGTSPGWVPLFVGKKLPAEALTFSTREAKHLRPVVLEIRLEDLVGNTWQASESSQRGDAGSCFWFPTPLPVTLVKRIVFASDEDRRYVSADAEDYGNVPLASFKRAVLKTAFTRTVAEPWPPTDIPRPRETPLQAPLAVGAVAAMFLHLGNRGNLSATACHAAFDPDEVPAALRASILAALPRWMRSGAVPAFEEQPADGQDTVYERLFWGAVERLVEWRGRQESGDAEDELLAYLRVELGALHERAKEGAEKLLETLDSLLELHAARVTELFARHRTPLARALILFFLHDRCVDLLEFENDDLNEMDCLVAAVFFGIRDGWLGLPLALRESPGLAEAVPDRMARLSHRMASTAVDFGARPPRPKPLRELFEVEGEAWSARQDKAAQELTHTLGWDCATTRISLGHDTYHLKIDRGGAHIETQREPTVTRIVHRGRFLDNLAKCAIGQDIEVRIRKQLVPRA